MTGLHYLPGKTTHPFRAEASLVQSTASSVEGSATVSGAATAGAQAPSADEGPSEVEYLGGLATPPYISWVGGLPVVNTDVPNVSVWPCFPVPCKPNCCGSTPGAGDMKRQKLERAQGKSFHLQCFGAKFAAAEPQAFDFVVDCCRFIEMEHLHCGFNDELIEAYIKSDGFQPMMRDVLHFVRQHKGGRATIAVVSDKGQHRSVVFGWALEKLIWAMGFTVSVEFLEYKRGNWSGLCTTCAKCALDSPFKKGVIQRLPLWFEV